MNPKAIIPVILVSTLIGGGCWIDQRRAAQASRLSGFFESQPTTVASRLPGRVARILVKEGDFVKKGQKLVELEAKPDVANYQAKVSQAEQSKAVLAEVEHGPRLEEIARQEAVVAEAEASLARLRNGSRPEEIRSAQERYAEASAIYRRALNGSRPQEIDQARAGAAIAYEKLKAAERGLTSEERAQAQARLDQAKASEELARRELERIRFLVGEGAVARQSLDRAEAEFYAAQARSEELRKAYERAQLGTPSEELGQAREAYRQAKAQADLVIAGPRVEDREAARAQMSQAEQALRLLQKGSRREDISAAEARLRAAQATLEELRNGSRKEQVDQARATASAAAHQADSAKASMSEQEIVAPFDGIVDRILVADGDLLSIGGPAIRMSDPTDIWLRVYVPEVQLAKIKSGDSVTLQVDGIPEEVPARVESIATEGEFTPANLQTPEERARQVFAVRVRLDPPNDKVKAGMGASVKKMGLWP